ncbi:MAG: hypothetical protein IPL52_02010 [Flavobacteriales bacterium]|nr:hypothetical protein [Flavobacteriales bacterium]
MNRLTRPTLLVLIIAGLLIFCKKENKIPLLLVQPTDRDIDVTSGQVTSFLIEGRSDNSNLTRLVITSKRNNGFTVTVKDSTLAGDRFLWNWEFVVAHATANYTEFYMFTLFDAEGETMSTSRTLYVTLGETLLTETSGHIFYSRNSGVHPESAFDLQDRVQVIYTADSTLRDLQDNPANGSTTELSRSWISPANGRMLRYNGFDYANATDISLKNAYTTGIPLQQIDNIQVGDIILTRLGSLPANTSHYAAIRVTGLVDDAGTADEDRYIFNLKWAVFVE